MEVREWLSGGVPDLERQRDDAFANYHQALGALRAIEATLRWLDEQAAQKEGAGKPAPSATEE